VAALYDLWRAHSTGLLSGGRLDLAGELALLREWLLPTGGPFLDVGTGTTVRVPSLRLPTAKTV